MTPEIKTMKTWAEAERWLAKHGWGIEQIREQKELWDKTHSTAKQAPSTPIKPKTAKAPIITKNSTVTE